jgi:hypothetical protein
MMLTYTDSDLARYWAKVERRGDDECWGWTASKAQGYGKIWLDGHLIGAHRMALAVHQGIGVPGPEWEIDHTCENKGCQNPAHLQWVAYKGRINSVLHFERRFGDRTHCPNGHPWTEQNVYRIGTYKACKLCRNKAACAAHKRAKPPRGPLLSDEQVAEVRRLHAEGRLTQRQIAARFGANKNIIWRIVNNKSRGTS